MRAMSGGVTGVSPDIHRNEILPREAIPIIDPLVHVKTASIYTADTAEEIDTVLGSSEACVHDLSVATWGCRTIDFFNSSCCILTSLVGDIYPNNRIG